MSEPEIMQQIIELCKLLSIKNMIAATDGNISYKIDSDKILITPSGINKYFLTADDYALIDMKGKILRGSPSSEYKIHLKIYEKCSTAKAVVHAHPPTAVAWSLAHPGFHELPCETLCEVTMDLGKIPIVTFETPGSSILANALDPYLPHCKALILAKHGTVAWGQSLTDAYNGIERIEHAALILKTVYELGGKTHFTKHRI